MHYLNVRIRVKQVEDAEKVGATLVRMAVLCHEEPGCMRWEAYQSESDSAEFLLVERWSSRPAWEAHLEREAIAMYKKEVLPLIEREVHHSRLIAE